MTKVVAGTTAVLNGIMKLASATSTSDICSRSVLRAAEPDLRGLNIIEPGVLASAFDTIARYFPLVARNLLTVFAFQTLLHAVGTTDESHDCCCCNYFFCCGCIRERQARRDAERQAAAEMGDESLLGTTARRFAT
jgi:hypothetical protein